MNMNRALMVGTINYIFPRLDDLPADSVQRALDLLAIDLERQQLPVPSCGLSPRLWLAQCLHTLEA